MEREEIEKKKEKIERKLEEKKEKGEKEGIKKRLKLSRPMIYLQIIKEIITYFTIIIDELIMQCTSEKQTDGETLLWNSITHPPI